MRSLLLALSASLMVVAGTFACSGSSASAPGSDGQNDAGGATSSSGGSSSGSDQPPDNGGSSGTVADSGGSPSDGGPTDSAPPPPQGDADVGDGAAGQLCIVGDTKVTFNSNAPGTAASMSGIPSNACGHVDPGSSEFVKFTLNAATFKTSWNYSSSPITLTATVEGQSFDLSSNNYVYKQGKEYVIEIKAAAATDWRLQLLAN